MIAVSNLINRRAELAVVTFKLLIVIACLSLLVVSVVDKVLMLDAEIGLWACNAVMVVLYLTAGGCFMLWFYALYKQLYLQSPQTLGVPPLWTVLGFSFPVANLFLPYVLVVKAWRRLQELNPVKADEFAGVATETPRYFLFWWCSHLICFFVVPTAYMAALTGLQHQESEMVQAGLSIFAYVMVCVSAVLAIRLVRELKSYTLRNGPVSVVNGK